MNTADAENRFLHRYLVLKNAIFSKKKKFCEKVIDFEPNRSFVSMKHVVSEVRYLNQACCEASWMYIQHGLSFENLIVWPGPIFEAQKGG